ncbi:MAG: ASCH domain-containing protein [Solobacterium sp.]|nr:ASCH domain-containing protein [Solobacterium sp.]MBR4163335.1 ASCH domain-containing protein [Solobacterium sp.]
MSRMLLSIKPEYVNKIVAGTKKYEFRKFRCREDVDTIVIYATSPVKQVIGEVPIISVIEDAVDEVWKQTRQEGGITEKAFMEYYKNKQVAVAYQLGAVMQYDEPMALSDVGLSYVPQSFAYI